MYLSKLGRYNASIYLLDFYTLFFKYIIVLPYGIDCHHIPDIYSPQYSIYLEFLRPIVNLHHNPQFAIVPRMVLYSSTH